MSRVLRIALRIGAAWLFIQPFAMTSGAATLEVQSRDFDIVLDSQSQTLLSLKPTQGSGFDFAPSKLSATRAGDGYYQLGDLDLRLRAVGDAQWRDYSTAYQRQPAVQLPSDARTLAAAEISLSLPSELGLRVVRRWQIGDDGNLSLRFELKNAGQHDIELGGVGLAMVFDNVLSKRSLAEAHTEASFADPYIGLDAGYLQVTRLNGQGPALDRHRRKRNSVRGLSPYRRQKGRARQGAVAQRRDAARSDVRRVLHLDGRQPRICGAGMARCRAME